MLFDTATEGTTEMLSYIIAAGQQLDVHTGSTA
jgi:hypothetical protein